LHLAQRPTGDTLSAAFLAEKEGLSLKYLEQVLSTLRKRGIVVSHRGKEGGYSLRLAPHEITLGDVIRAIDGPLAPMPCASRTLPHKDPDCPYPYETCWLRLLMLRVRDNISSVLDQETLEDMVHDAKGMRDGPKGDKGGKAHH